MIDLLLENQIIKLVEQSRKEAEEKLKSSYSRPEEVLKDIIKTKFRNVGLFNNNSNIIYVDKVNIEKQSLKPKTQNDRTKSVLGSALIFAGQPILKKRFVMAGSATGTSIASKYLSKILPQKLPIRVLGTTVLGRAIGRVVPIVGWTLLAIDIVEIIIEYSELEQDLGKGFGKGFGGGDFGGGGAGGSW